MLLNARRIFTKSHKTELILLAIEDISKRKKLEKALLESREILKYTTYHDALTGLFNRAYYDEEMSRLGRDLSRSKPLSIISIDIDGLKIINDTLGHKMGDDLLISAAKIISMPFRKIDLIARVGGDEFCIILPRTDNQTVQSKKKEIIKLITKNNNENPLSKMKMSIGVATSQDQTEEDIYQIYQRADKNMYQCKNAHSNTHLE
ncbi:MAG: GGDEF domain-containing protein [Candidatus Omnitrophica bacterium]|nr:GGDEF domain-containing protein [Candidatus Omnitrophota bacterium]